ncbi:hypothetical protein [Streptomyces sp. WMMC940]|nr:hypothetical protein [Streptomyces sp. WMMC940]MCZ7461851.1 hypothetical protein [Streptomyces sp. WMMC940]
MTRTFPDSYHRRIVRAGRLDADAARTVRVPVPVLIERADIGTVRPRPG